MAGKIIIGPILGFRGARAGCWHTSALVVIAGTDQPPLLTVVANNTPLTQAKPVLLKMHAGHYVWRLDWWVVQNNTEQLMDYVLNNGPTYRYVVPELNKPLRICYGSCFGMHTLQDVAKIKDKNTMWKVLERVHQEKPYHLFFLGGDQVYADQVWEVVPGLREWLNKKLNKRVLTPFTPELEEAVRQFYFDLYIQMWSQKHPAQIMSQIPTLMMWDDHDIFDGWGSYAPAQQESAVFKGVYQQAREHFRLFQLQAKDDADLGAASVLGEDSFTYALRLGDLALIALDLRSERTQNQVMSPDTWNNLQNWMTAELTENTKADKGYQKGCKHLLLMSGIPIVNADLTLLEAALEWRPGQQRVEDDLKDQWLSWSHRQERLEFIQRLLAFSEQSSCRITIVSGDAHLAFMGYIQSDKETATGTEPLVINQLTSSAMVNLPPPALVVYMMEKLLAGKTEAIDQGIFARLLKFPGTNRRILGARNWLSLTLNEQPAITAAWYVEGEEKPYVKVIPPVQLK